MRLSYNTEDVMELIYCNKCGRVIKTRNEIPLEDFVKVKKAWGYFSKKDGRTQEFILCEDCVEWLEREFIRPSRIYETVEMI